MKNILVLCSFFLVVLACKKEPSNEKQIEEVCYSQKELCNKKYNEVCFLGSHNAFNYKGPFAFPNQNISIVRQLERGVRCFLIDIYKEGDQLLLYHSFKPLGFQTAETVFGGLKTYMEAHPEDVVTLIIQNDVSVSDLGNFYRSFGLEPIAYIHDESKGWPTLGEMVKSGRRLVSMVEGGDGGLASNPFILDGYKYMFENEYEHASLSDFDCDENRGSGGKRELYLLNHWIGGIGDEEGAKKVNKYDFLSNQAQDCMTQKGRIINFIALDFVELGDGLKVVNEINGVE
jgi:hypothetical protein